MGDCCCSSKRRFKDCCEPYLKGKSKPRSVKQLMRSRYSAYALGGYEDYLYKTWHPARAKNISREGFVHPNRQWKGLEIINYRQQGDLGRVEFKATYADNDDADQVHHEKSAFVRVNGSWLYLEGDVYQTENENHS